MDTGYVFLIHCVRAAEHRGNMIPGSQIRHCRDCGEQIIAAPSSLEAVEKLGAVLLCHQCGQRYPIDVLSLTPPATSEFVDVMRRAISRQVERN